MEDPNFYLEGVVREKDELKDFDSGDGELHKWMGIGMSVGYGITAADLKDVIAEQIKPVPAKTAITSDIARSEGSRARHWSQDM